MHYRPEIDGLRAVAVVLVVFFHAQWRYVSGGFIGVDIFFVLSGYLITSIILRDLHRDRFSFVNFYERRARRILPAMVFVIAATAVVAALFMAPFQIEELSASIAATALFSANVYFWRTINYFGTAAEETPLLHMWSLAVEEQFYIVFPVLLLLLWWSGRRNLILPAVLAISAVSLVLAEIACRTHPVANFYLPVGRVWELGAGAALALIEPSAVSVRRTVGSALAFAGLAMIAVSAVAFDASTPSPSLLLSIPVIGTLLVVRYARPDVMPGRLLASAPFVAVGLVSYSFYLWHQPVFAFSRMFGIEFDSAYVTQITLALLLAAFSWRFVEQPFRKRRSGWIALGWSTAILATLVVLGIGVHTSPNLVERWYIASLSPPENERYRMLEAMRVENVAFEETDGRLEVLSECVFRTPAISDAFRTRWTACADMHGPAVVVAGGSHASDVFQALASTERVPFLVGVTRANCRPHRRIQGPPPVPCPYEDLAAFVQAEADRIALLLYTQAAHTLYRDGRFLKDPSSFEPELVSEVAGYLEQLAQAVPVVVLGPRRMLGRKLQNLSPRFPIMDQLQASYTPGIAAAEDRVDGAFREAFAQTHVRYVSGIDLLAADLPEDAIIDGRFTYRDQDHWSAYGARVFGERIADWLSAEEIGSGQNPAGRR